MFPGDPVPSTSFDQFNDLTTAAGYPTITTTTADDIDWTALGCLPPSEQPANSLESQSQGFASSIDSPDPPFDHNQPTILTTAPSTTHTTAPATSLQSIPMPSATSLPTTSSTSPTSRESSPKEKENPSRIAKRQLNTMAARRYRQRKLDKVAQLEEELAAIKRERDELKMRVSKLEGETEVLRSMVKDKS
ncbi:bZIP transcription factor JlbA/IDI-4 [Aspergillus mulundensis]|uniref:BZIP domain-containing protein n=1 Tax=Aspergillus mulundensis TaxID=1810919 RepID=A0A3D8S5E7_9EURO|nr:Uncharacterized protein DSM5745_05092 [Aspergillus mulundensis]RDW81535.1 Uncharacterized protein DSM5745_05092 [Aspergillus mulundensis]